jgi:hypothetical protein
MSLPGTVYFIKDKRIVGCGYASMPYDFDLKEVEKGIFTALGYAYRFWNTPVEELSGWELALHSKDKIFFTTKEDLQQYQYVEIFNFTIPREVVNKLLFTCELSSAEFVKQLQEGIYDVEESTNECH